MKKVFCLIVSIIFFFMFSLGVNAYEDSAEHLQEEYYNQMFDSLSDEAKELIEEAGLNSIKYEKLAGVTPKDFFSFLANIVTRKTDGPLKNFIYIITFLMITSLLFTFIPTDEKRKDFIFSLTCASMGLVCAPSFISLVKSSMSIIDMTSKFMLSFIPVLAGLAAACRNPLVAMNMNSATIYLANIISSFSNKVLVSFITMYLALSSVGCIQNEINLSILANYIKNTVLKILSVLSSFFISFISIKGVFANAADTVASKGTKIIISSVIPVIGSSLSEAYSAVSDSLSLLKSSVGVFGIISILAMNMPVVIELFLWNMCLSMCSMIASILEMKTIENFLNSICSVLKILNLIVIFCGVLFIISTGLMITIRSMS